MQYYDDAALDPGSAGLMALIFGVIAHPVFPVAVLKRLAIAHHYASFRLAMKKTGDLV